MQLQCPPITDTTTTSAPIVNQPAGVVAHLTSHMGSATFGPPVMTALVPRAAAGGITGKGSNLIKQLRIPAAREFLLEIEIAQLLMS